MDAPPERLVAAIDMGSNSFKLLLARSLPSGRLLPVIRLKEPLPLLRGAPFSEETQIHAISALKTLTLALKPHPVQSLRLVATAAFRDSPNRSELVAAITAELGLRVHVISGEEEARLTYLGVLQFLPVYERLVLLVDIGGGSTELLIGKQGRVLFATSLELGHLSLTENFVKKGDLIGLRSFVREVIGKSDFAEKSRELGRIEMVIGSSGTVRWIGRAIARDLIKGEFRTEWGFSRDELGSMVEKLGIGEEEKVRAFGFSRRRAGVIFAGAVLLLEIFDALGIKEMEISEYGLVEGVIVEMIAKENVDYDWSANARWRSVVSLAARFDGGNRMKSAFQRVGVAKDIFYGLKKCYDLVGISGAPISFDEKEFECLEAALLLCNIGKVIGKKGYHKHSYCIIKNCGHLPGYSSEEIKLIALLARYHRKKFPRKEHDSVKELHAEMRHKFRVLCVIIRIALVLQKCQFMAFKELEVFHSPEGFNVVLSGVNDGLSVAGDLPPVTLIQSELNPELDHFEEIFHQKLLVSFPQKALGGEQNTVHT
ncbi:putative exopolyphosphatase [Dioscorea cayenensis subsp. rotundata]|uniref:Exopolyphosphatase n=1 Tax=Dioscorea cayennensis subsp. rotundata TaxID=55577 RepID=A0AB40BK08_DIOCR|nr:putative exopolyphosphatase [Dioscorea cayenensis subsp. rotundata]